MDCAFSVRAIHVLIQNLVTYLIYGMTAAVTERKLRHYLVLSVEWAVEWAHYTSRQSINITGEALIRNVLLRNPSIRDTYMYIVHRLWHRAFTLHT